MKRAIIFCISLLGLAPTAFAQQLDANPPAGDQRPAIATIWFQVDWPDADPTKFAIAVTANGEASYTSTGKNEDDPYRLQFKMTPASTKAAFAAADRLSYFNGDWEYKKHRVAFTGKKTLTYADGHRRFSTSFNYSENGDIAALNRLFQGIALTIEHDRKLEFLMRYNKLGLYDELKAIRETQKDGWLGEVEIMAPRLETIVNDVSIMHVARVKASEILANAGIPAGK